MDQRKKVVYLKLLQKIQFAKNIAVISHDNPDLDTLGSAIAIRQLIIRKFNDKNVELYCSSKIDTKYDFFPNIELFNDNLDPSRFDLIIAVDMSSPSQSGFFALFPDLLDKSKYKNTINIDHHRTNKIWLYQNIVLALESSTSSIIFEIFDYLGFEFDNIAKMAIIASIYTDTGGLKHSNVSSKTLKNMSKLFYSKDDLQFFLQKFYKNNSLQELKFWGRIINQSFIDSQDVLQVFISKTNMDLYDMKPENVYGIIDLLSGVEESKYTQIITNKGDYIKCSLRTLRDDIDLSKLAGKHAGGGHKKAASYNLNANVKINNSISFIQNDK